MNVVLLIINVLFAAAFLSELNDPYSEHRGFNGFFLCMALHNITTYAGRLL